MDNLKDSCVSMDLVPFINVISDSPFIRSLAIVLQLHSIRQPAQCTIRYVTCEFTINVSSSVVTAKSSQQIDYYLISVRG